VGAVAALIVAATIAAGLLPRTPALSEVAVKLNVPLPPTVVQIDPTVKISPDGLRVVFAAQTSEGLRRLWVRALDSLDAYPLMETDGATQPFWSADGRALGFFVSGQLKRIDVMGGTVATICPALQANGGTWNADDVIVFSSQGELRRVAATGGTVTTLKGANGARDGASLTYPSFLPDGQHLLYLDTGSGGKDEAAVYAAALNAADRTLVLPAAKSNALYSDGYLFYLRDTTLVAQPFDTGRLKLGGDAVAIAEEVQRTPNVPGGAFSISDRVLAYRAGALARGLPTQLQLFDRTGKVLGTVGDRADYADVELSPDGTHAAVSVLNPGTGRDIWIFDIARGIPTRFTSDPADEYGSVWSPDGTQIIFTSRTKGHFDLYQKAASGAGAEQELLEDKFDKWPMSWSSDGKTLIYSTGRISSVGVVPQLWGVNLVGTRVPFQALDDSQFTQFPGKLSPDGHWLAYTSNESGQSEIYVVSFPSRNIKLRVSTAGGSWPRWSHNGKELFFIADNTKMMSAEVTTDGSKLSIGTVRMLFEARWPQGARYVYDVAPNGNIFGAIRLEPPAASPITLVVNWRSDLKK
jgi:dipeptidyl aminopeptidase/acylaminoacyl peptidase